jgi:hypothetical protein
MPINQAFDFCKNDFYFLHVIACVFKGYDEDGKCYYPIMGPLYQVWSGKNYGHFHPNVERDKKPMYTASRYKDVVYIAFSFEYGHYPQNKILLKYRKGTLKIY